VADSGNDTIRKITPAGVVTTLAGAAGQIGSTDGTGGAARFNDPAGVAVDNAANLYVADTNNNKIRKISPGGTVTTLAGSGVVGWADGTGSAAQFYKPQGVAVDSSGNVYVADSGNNLIRSITPGGTVTTLAGATDLSPITNWGDSDGTGSAASFNNPGGIAVDREGHIYVADTDNNQIREITPGGTVTTLAGGPFLIVDELNDSHYGEFGSADGIGSAALFSFPLGVAVDRAGFVYVADGDNGTIRQVSPGGVVTTVAGSVAEMVLADGVGAAVGFYSPAGIAVDSADNLYIADSGNSTIRKGVPGPPSSPALAAQPLGQTVWAGQAATFSATVAAVPDPTFQWQVSTDGGGTWSNLTDGNGISGSATAVLNVDGLNGNQYKCVVSNSVGSVTTSSAALVTIANEAYTFTTLAGTRPGGTDGTGSAASFNNPEGVAVDSLGNIFIADNENDTIRRITPPGVVTTLAGTAGQIGSADGTGGAAQFSHPEGVAVDISGNVYVADTWNNTIRKITTAGVVTTLAGTAGQGGSADGTGDAAQLNYPTGVAVDNQGNLYVADAENFKIRKITPGRVVSTLAGSGISGFLDGASSVAQFYYPARVAVDQSGNVYVADTGAFPVSVPLDQSGNVYASDIGEIRKVTPAGSVTTLARGVESRGVAVDSAGFVYVVANNVIEKLTPDGSVSTIAGGAQGNVDGTGIAAQFSSPGGIAVDGAGSVYVADTGNDTIRKGSSIITGQPVSQTVATGGTVVFTVTAGGSVQTSSLAFSKGVSAMATAPTTYAWEFNGQALSDGNGIFGSTGPQLVIQHATAANNGDYVCIVENSAGKATSDSASLLVEATSNPGSVSSASSRAYVGTGDNILIGGFYIVGSTSATVLVQAIGPTLAEEPYNVTGTLQHPALTIHQNQNGKDVVLYSNTGWGSNPVLLAAAAAVYAQPVLTAGAADSEVLLTLPPGGYTAEVTGADGGTGVALCAIYQLP
jgi:sugar lactone lactonase YvrE